MTNTPIPSVVNSAVIARIIDLLRTQGFFRLSVYYAICLELLISKISKDLLEFPSHRGFEKAGSCFE